MTKKTIKNRVYDLENAHSEKPIISVFQDLTDREKWHIGDKEGDPVTWDQVEAEYSDYVIIRVIYTGEAEL